MGTRYIAAPFLFVALTTTTCCGRVVYATQEHDPDQVPPAVDCALICPDQQPVAKVLPKPWISFTCDCPALHGGDGGRDLFQITTDAYACAWANEEWRSTCLLDGGGP